MSDERWLSDWLLGEGSDEERRRMEARLAADPALRERARRLEAVTGRLHDLPPTAWEAITDRDVHPVPRPRRRPAISRAAIVGFAAGIVFAAGLGAGELLHGSSSAPPARSAPPAGQTVALRPLAGTPAQAAGVAYLSGADELQLDVSHLPATDTGHYYEAWLMSSARRLVPLASFRVDADGRARLQLQLPAAAGGYRYIDISLQRVGAGTAHSRDSLLRGPTVSG